MTQVLVKKMKMMGAKIREQPEEQHKHKHKLGQEQEQEQKIVEKIRIEEQQQQPQRSANLESRRQGLKRPRTKKTTTTTKPTSAKMGLAAAVAADAAAVPKPARKRQRLEGGARDVVVRDVVVVVEEEEEEEDAEEHARPNRAARTGGAGAAKSCASPLERLPPSILGAVLENLVKNGAEGVLALRAASRASKNRCTQLLLKSGMLDKSTASAWCKDLGDLAFDHDSPICDTELCDLASKCPKIRGFAALHCEKVSAHGLKMFFSLSRDLEEVHIERCGAVNAETLAWLAEKCPKLRALRLAHCPNLDAAGVRVLVQNCALEEVEVRHCAGISDEAVAALLSGAGPQIALRSLSLEGCVALNDVALRAIAHACPALQTLDISGLTAITDRSLGTLAKGCPRLRHLAARGCTGVGSAGVALVLRLCAALEHLDVAGTAVSDICFLSIGAKRRSARLAFLGLDRCAALSPKGVREARAKFPQAVVVETSQAALPADDAADDRTDGEASPLAEAPCAKAWHAARPSTDVSTTSALASKPTATAAKRAGAARPLASLARPPFMPKIHARGLEESSQVARRRRRLSTRAMIMQQLIASTHSSIQSDSEASEPYF